MEELRLEDAYYVGTSIHSYRYGEPARIVGIKTLYVENRTAVCFHIVFADGKDDWCPVSDYENYKVLTDKEVELSYREKQ